MRAAAAPVGAGPTPAPAAPPTLLKEHAAVPTCTWAVPRTAHTGGTWSIVDGFATEEECAALVAAAGGLDELAEPLARYAAPPLRADYRSADGAALDGAMRPLAVRAAKFTGVPERPDADAWMIARTAALRSAASDPAADVPAARTAREGSVDSEGFLLAPAEDAARGAEDDLAAGEYRPVFPSAPSLPRVVNVHHDHNRDARRSCTTFLYLTDPARGDASPSSGTVHSVVSPSKSSAGGETFFPCAGGDALADDALAAKLTAAGAAGTHVVWSGDDAEEGSEGPSLVAMCEDRLAATRRAARVPPGAPPGVIENVGAPGLLVSPRVGRAVIFWHGASAGDDATAWHAPITVTERAPSAKWLATFFKTGPGPTDGAEAGAAAEADRGAVLAEGARGARPETETKLVPGATLAELETCQVVEAETVPVNEEEEEEEGSSSDEEVKEEGVEEEGVKEEVKEAGTAATATLSEEEVSAEHALMALGEEPAAPIPRGVPTAKGKPRGMCLVDDCQNPRKHLTSKNPRLPLVCTEHAKALTVMYGGVPSRECQACRTFHPLDAFDSDNMTCETRLLRKKLRYRAKTLVAAAEFRADGNPAPKKRGRPSNASRAAAAQAEAMRKGSEPSRGDQTLVGSNRLNTSALPPHLRAEPAAAIPMNPLTVAAAAEASAAQFMAQVRARHESDARADPANANRVNQARVVQVAQAQAQVAQAHAQMAQAQAHQEAQREAMLRNALYGPGAAAGLLAHPGSPGNMLGNVAHVPAATLANILALQGAGLQGAGLQGLGANGRANAAAAELPGAPVEAPRGAGDAAAAAAAAAAAGAGGEDPRVALQRANHLLQVAHAIEMQAAAALLGSGEGGIANAALQAQQQNGCSIM